MHRSQSGRLDEAIAACRRAIELEPELAEAHNNLGNALKDQGRLDQAIAAYHRAIELKPVLAEAHINLGIASDGPAAARRGDRRLPPRDRAQPRSAETHNNLGIVLQEMGRLDEAIAACHRAIQLRPELCRGPRQPGQRPQGPGPARRGDRRLPPGDPAQARPGRGPHERWALLSRSMGRLDEAIAAYHRAIQLQPELAEAHNNLGNALLDRGRLDEAIAACRRAIELEPAWPRRTTTSAMRCGIKAGSTRRSPPASGRSSLSPSLAEAHNNLGNALLDQGRLDEAIAACSARAIELKPGLAEAHNNLGNALLDQGQLDAAIAAYRPRHRAQARAGPGPPQPGQGPVGPGPARRGVRRHAAAPSSWSPTSPRPTSIWATSSRIKGASTLHWPVSAAALERDPAYALAASNLAYVVHFHPDYDARAILAENRRWDAHFAVPLAKTIQPHSNQPDPGSPVADRLRLARLSRHPVGRFMLPLLESHDHDKS